MPKKGSLEQSPSQQLRLVMAPKQRHLVIDAEVEDQQNWVGA
jgi:hypothetical protein